MVVPLMLIAGSHPEGDLSMRSSHCALGDFNMESVLEVEQDGQ